jgi:hypothetical protein
LEDDIGSHWLRGRVTRGGRAHLSAIRGGENLNHKINPKNDDSDKKYLDGEKMIATDLNMLGEEFYLYLARTAKFI